MGLRRLLQNLVGAFARRSPSGQSYFDPPDYVVVLLISHILELPRDLGVRDGAALLKTEPREDILGQQPARYYHEVWQMPEFQEGTAPTTRLVFRRTNVGVQLPLQAADQCFADWARPLHSPEEWEARMRLLETTVEQGLEAPVTVVGATRFLPVERWPRGRAAQEELMRAELDVVLDDLNDYIIALGLVTNDARRRPVAVGDLPFLCPVVLEGVPMAEGQRVGANFIYPIHDVTQGPHAVPEVSDEQFKHAALLSRDAFTKAMPFWPFYEFMFRCHSDAVLNRFAEATVSLGTAIEVLFATIVRVAGPMIGEEDSKTRAVLDCPLRSLVEHHLSRYCHTPVDLGSTENPFGRWWAEGYALRNRVVHEGYRPKEAEFDTAYGAASALIAAVKQGLKNDPRTAALGEALTWGKLEVGAGADR